MVSIPSLLGALGKRFIKPEGNTDKDVTGAKAGGPGRKVPATQDSVLAGRCSVACAQRIMDGPLWTAQACLRYESGSKRRRVLLCHTPHDLCHFWTAQASLREGAAASGGECSSAALHTYHTPITIAVLGRQMLLQELFVQGDAQAGGIGRSDHPLIIELEGCREQAPTSLALGHDVLHDQAVGDGGHQVHV